MLLGCCHGISLRIHPLLAPNYKGMVSADRDFCGRQAGADTAAEWHLKAMLAESENVGHNSALSFVRKENGFGLTTESNHPMMSGRGDNGNMIGRTE